MPTKITKPAAAKAASKSAPKAAAKAAKPTAKAPAVKAPAKQTAVKKTAVKKTAATKAVQTPKAATPKKPVAAKVAKTPKSAAKPAVAKPIASKAVKTPLKIDALKPAPKKPVAKKAAPKAVKVVDSIEQLARDVAKVLDTNKAEQIVTIPLAGRSSLADWMVIASGKSARQVGALANYVQRTLTDAGCKRVRVEGLPQGDWVVIDSGDVVTHLFRPEVRDYYQLERLWAEDEGEPAQTRTLR